jgi:hypothetical protein
VNYAKLLEMNSFFILHSFLEVGKTQDLPSKFWQTLGDARHYPIFLPRPCARSVRATRHLFASVDLVGNAGAEFRQ